MRPQADRRWPPATSARLRHSGRSGWVASGSLIVVVATLAAAVSARPAQLLVRRSGDDAPGAGGESPGPVRATVRDRRDPGAAASALAASSGSGSSARRRPPHARLSVLCGVATVVLIYEIGRVGFDAATGLWAAWLAALSPLLIVYAREARMYAWLVLVTCLCWRLLLALRRTYTPAKAVAYVVSLTALIYSHPLGLLMLATLALAGLIDLGTCFGTWRRWLVSPSRRGRAWSCPGSAITSIIRPSS